ncbi:hypothetical protein M8J75_004258 [Diaphorina citri]|nr:hypothetical protein M8J75_004258 [Diaphorina citri]
MKRRGRSQVRLNKNIIDNFNDETYIKLKSIVEKLGGRNNDDKIKNIFDEACEKWALKHDEVIKLNNKNDDLIKECEDLKDDKKALKNKVKELEKRMNALIEESEAQKNGPDDELNKEKFQCLKEGYEELQNEKDAMANKIRGLERRIKHLVEESDEQANSTNKELDERNIIIKSMEKQLKDLKMRESENYEDFTKLEQERNKLKNHIVKLEKTIEIHKQEHIENYEYIKTLELERKGLNFTISTLEKTIQRFENLGYKQMEKTLADDSIIDLENTVTHNSMLQFTKSFSIAHNETTFQEELDTLNCNKELAGQNENSNDLMEKERNMKHKETNDRDETKIEDHELGKLEKRESLAPPEFNYLKTLQTPLYNLTITEDETLKLLLKSKLDSSSGPDGIPPIVLKKCARAIVQPLVILFNRLLVTGTYPQTWKISYIIPIFKGGRDRSNIAQYRPICKISAIPKLFEHIIYTKLTPILSPLIISNQHGFIKNKSTTSNLVSFIECVNESVEAGHQFDCCATDYSKGFDKRVHKAVKNGNNVPYTPVETVKMNREGKGKTR